MDGRTRNALRERLLAYDLSSVSSIYAWTVHSLALTMNGEVVKVKNCPNGDEHFGYKERAVFAAVPESDCLWAILHTHPAGMPKLPSAFDLASLRQGFLGVVYHISTGSLTLYRNNAVIITTRRSPCPSAEPRRSAAISHGR